LIHFQHFIDGLLALAALDLAVWTSCPDLTATFITTTFWPREHAVAWDQHLIAESPAAAKIILRP
jgi:hypothetical protein